MITGPPLRFILSETSAMRSRYLLPAVLLAVGCTFGWLTASGRLTETFAQDRKAADPPAPASSTQLPKPDPAFKGKIKRTFFRHGLEPFEVGRDSITPVDPAYKDKGKFEFTSQIDKVTFELK